MKTKFSNLLILLCVVVLVSTTSKAQEFDSFQNIENFLSLTPKELDSKLNGYGYIYDSKYLGTDMTVKTFIKQNSGLTVNYGYKENKILMFMWDDKIDKGAYIVRDIGDNKNYQIVESKTDDYSGVFYLESKTSDLDVIIFKTLAQTQNGKIGFNLFRNKEKNLKK